MLALVSGDGECDGLPLAWANDATDVVAGASTVLAPLTCTPRDDNKSMACFTSLDEPIKAPPSDVRVRLGVVGARVDVLPRSAGSSVFGDVGGGMGGGEHGT